MYRDVTHASRYLQAVRLGDANPTPRRQPRRPRIWVGRFLTNLGERLLAGLEYPVGTGA